MIQKLLKWIKRIPKRIWDSVRHELYDLYRDIKKAWKEAKHETVRVWLSYDLKCYRWWAIPVMIFLITIMNILYTIVMYVGAVVITFLMGVIIPFMFILVGPTLWVLEKIFKYIELLMTKNTPDCREYDKDCEEGEHYGRR